PVVNVVKPGRDWRASNIEEVSLQVEANDDFGLDNVELRYSINGGEWHSVPIAADGPSAVGEQILYLEDMTKPVRAPRQRSRIGLNDRGGLNLDDLRVLRPGAEPDRGEAQESADSEGAAESGAAAASAAPAEQGLEPGDLISYYVVAEDRGQAAQTDLFFVEVQPFDRSYSQSSQAGG